MYTGAEDRGAREDVPDSGGGVQAHARQSHQPVITQARQSLSFPVQTYIETRSPKSRVAITVETWKLYVDFCLKMEIVLLARNKTEKRNGSEGNLADESQSGAVCNGIGGELECAEEEVFDFAENFR